MSSWFSMSWVAVVAASYLYQLLQVSCIPKVRQNQAQDGSTPKSMVE